MHLAQALSRAATINPSGTATVFRGRRRGWAETADRVARWPAASPASGSAGATASRSWR